MKMMNAKVSAAAFLVAASLWAPGLRMTHAESPATMASSQPDKTAAEKKEADELDASLVPEGCTELRLNLLAYTGDVTVTKALAHGSAVKAGDQVLWLEARGFALQLATARNDLVVAQAALEKAKADAVTGAETDRISLETATHDLQIAKENVTWFQTVDGPAMLKESELRVKGAKDSVEDAGDELDQLKKMYKSEELTNATADIVVKRALRSYENDKVNLDLTKAAAEKTPKQEYPTAKLHVEQALATAENGLAATKATLALNASTRATGLAAAEIALKKAQQSVADLEHDETQLIVKAPVDGNFYHGYWAGKTWANGDLRMLMAGEKVSGGSIIGTVAVPGKLAVTGEVPDEKWKAYAVGAKLKVKVAGVELKGTVTELVPEARPGGNAIVFRASVSDVPGWMIAGMKAKVEVAGQ